ncbi:MAG: extracellular solute-binding protein [Rubellimicrobium sp.]|nr:extracellular solute-binding protein [Rubellimicrobium sp.]
MRIVTVASASALALAAASAMAQDSQLTVFDYAGFELPEYHETYIALHGTSPTFTFFGDEDEAFQKVTSGFRPDVTHICAGSVNKWTEAGIIEPWDTSRLTWYDDLDANLMGTDTSQGEAYFIPTDWGSTAIIYNPDEVPAEDVASLQVFKDPKYAGRMTVPYNVDDTWALAFLATGTTDMAHATDEQIDAAADWLREVHPNLRTYWTDPAELAQLVATGEILIAWAWNETFPTLVEEGVPVEFQREAVEGSSVWLCGMVNMANGAGDEQRAYDYLNAFLDPSATVPLVENGYGSANATAMADQISEEDLEAAGLGHIDVPIAAQLPMSQELRERLAEEFELIKSGF